MSAGPDLSFLALPLVGFLGTTAVAVGGAVWTLRGAGKQAAWAPSLGCSTAATVAGALLIAEVGTRILLNLLALRVRVQPFPLTGWLYFSCSLPLGPGLFFVAYTRRARSTPRRIYALQAVQLVAWALSCFFTFLACLVSSQ